MRQWKYSYHLGTIDTDGSFVFVSQSIDGTCTVAIGHLVQSQVALVARQSIDGMSGFRVGSLFTQNEALKAAMDTISYYSSVSEFTQYALTGMLSDIEWWDWYIAENQRRLEAVFYAAKEAFDSIGVPVFPSTGALFVWADFLSFLLPGQTEKEVWLELFYDAKILFAMGESFFGEKLGMFRVVYTWPMGGTVAMKELGKRLVHWKESCETKSE